MRRQTGGVMSAMLMRKTITQCCLAMGAGAPSRARDVPIDVRDCRQFISKVHQLGYCWRHLAFDHRPSAHPLQQTRDRMRLHHRFELLHQPMLNVRQQFRRQRLRKAGA